MNNEIRGRQTVIPCISDKAADAANRAAIDALVGTTSYPYIVAWGKYLGFTPATVQAGIAQAEADGAPSNSIQKIDGRWHTLDDIANESNRRKVEAIAVTKVTSR